MLLKGTVNNDNILSFWPKKAKICSGRIVVDF